jgi:type VI protein secretion system component VasF
VNIWTIVALILVLFTTGLVVFHISTRDRRAETAQRINQIDAYIAQIKND